MGGGALVLPPFIASEASVFCSRPIGRLLLRERERGRESEGEREWRGEESEHVSILTHKREQKKATTEEV